MIGIPATAAVLRDSVIWFAWIVVSWGKENRYTRRDEVHGPITNTRARNVMAEEKKTAMISSTSVDLPEHRKEAIDACLRQGFFPIAMEHLPARDADAIRVSLEMVNKADVYIGIYAWRYGHVPEGRDISITEIEFDRAVERGIPILVFLIHKDHPLTIEMVETDKVAQENLKQLKE